MQPAPCRRPPACSAFTISFSFDRNLRTSIGTGKLLMALARQALATVVIPDNPAQREFDFSEADFQALSKVAYEHAGIMLPEAKKNLLYGRLSRRLRSLGLTSFEEYRQYLKENSGQELQLFINALSTNHTKFFREQHHFEHFVSDVVTPFLAANPTGGRLRVWSAG